MVLYFVNGSHQKKEIIESEYADDLYDMLIGFFEEHKHFPRFLEMRMDGDELIINFESQSEYFLIEEINDEEIKELEELVGEYHR